MANLSLFPGSASPRAQPALRIRTAPYDDLGAPPVFRPIEFAPPTRAADGHPHPPHPPPEPLRSIFPVYNPGLPPDRQCYAPTRVLSAVVRRPSRHHCEKPPSGRRTPTPDLPAPGPRESPAGPRPCSTSQLRGLWKAANGWKACGSEGRVYRLALSRLRDAPVYTLSSSSDRPFYNLRLDPTSASAYVALARLDPAKPYKPPKSDAASPSSPAGSRASDTKGWHQALTTTLEHPSRRRPPHDGLVALLMPAPAATMALQQSDDPVAVTTAENECARLVWDDAAAAHFLVLPALATPFRVAVESCPAYSRTEYALEHHQSPGHLAKLIRDGTGGGCVEIDTTVAAMIDSYYVIDLAVAALLLVAAADDRDASAPLEAFEPPPPPPRAVLAGRGKRVVGRLRMPALRPKDRDRDGQKAQEFDMDVESQ